MSQSPALRRDSPGRNLAWLLASLFLAFCVWFVATLDRDPVNERIFRNVPVLLTGNEGLIITSQSRENATVTVRAPESTLARLVLDDVVVRADLSGLGPGEHSVALQTSVTRNAIPDTAPRSIFVHLEPLLEKEVPVTVDVTLALPRGFAIGAGGPQPAQSTVTVNGPQPDVERVVSARLPLNLAQRRSDFSDEPRLFPVDADGGIVAGVTLSPPTLLVEVPVRTRSDLRQISVQPYILADTLPEGLTLSSVTYNPQVVLVSGAPEALENAPDTLFTEPVSLEGRNSSFEVQTRVSTTGDDLFVFGGQGITVSIGITPLLTSRQFDQAPVEFIGLAGDRVATLSPETVTVLITGARNALESMSAGDLHVLVDLQELEEGSHSVVPDVSHNLDSKDVENISVLPSGIDVFITVVGAGAAESDGGDSA